jgi:hypothetical protein
VAEKRKPTTIVRATTHPSETRSNPPTAELEWFARPEQKKPKIVRYPRDPTLDPQLVWKGKDEQDAADLAVPAIPIYIGETIVPLSLIEELRAEGEGRQTDEQRAFFAPYADLTFSEKVEFYRHPGKWANRMILGDSLLVMTSLAENEGLKGQVQTIYIDPPYGIKFGSNWQVSAGPAFRTRSGPSGSRLSGSTTTRAFGSREWGRTARVDRPRPSRSPSGRSPDRRPRPHPRRRQGGRQVLPTCSSCAASRSTRSRGSRP